MEQTGVAETERAAPSRDAGPEWRDLREWIALIERNGELKRIASRSMPTRSSPPSPAWRRARETRAGAAVREHRRRPVRRPRALPTCWASSKERYALAVGLDPDARRSAEMIAATRAIMKRRIAPVRMPKPSRAPVNEVVLRGNDIDLTDFPGAEILARRRRPLHRHRRHHASRAIPTPAASMSAATGRCCTGRAASASIARPASTGGSTATPGGRAASRARWSRPTASIRCCSCSARRCSAPRNPSSMSPAA